MQPLFIKVVNTPLMRRSTQSGPSPPSDGAVPSDLAVAWAGRLPAWHRRCWTALTANSCIKVAGVRYAVIDQRRDAPSPLTPERAEVKERSHVPQTCHRPGMCPGDHRPCPGHGPGRRHPPDGADLRDVPAAEFVRKPPPGMVQALQRDLLLTRVQAETRLLNEARLTPIEASLRRRIGDHFAGAWFVGDIAQILVVATVDPDDASLIASLGARPLVVSRSLADLESDQDEGRRGAGPRPRRHGVRYIDVRTNKVVTLSKRATSHHRPPGRRRCRPGRGTGDSLNRTDPGCCTPTRERTQRPT